MDTYGIRHCPICQSDHWVLTADDEKDLWALFKELDTLSTIEKDKLRDVLQDVSTSKICASQEAVRDALATAEREHDDKMGIIAQLEDTMKENETLHTNTQLARAELATAEHERDTKNNLITELQRKLQGQERALQQNEDLHMGIEEKWEEGKKAKDNMIAQLREENLQLASQLERAQGREQTPAAGNGNQRHTLQRRPSVADLRRKAFMGAAPIGIAKSRHVPAAPNPARNLRERTMPPLTGVNIHPLPAAPTGANVEDTLPHMPPRGGRGRKLTCKKCYTLRVECSGGYPCKLCRRDHLTCKYSRCAYFNTEVGCLNPDCGFVHDEKVYQVR
ncbi:hypothetical protein BU16DRAFT_596299 [Lophium mytilinum]|uniref:Zn(2)-C6 fungal-type domain-containing protein n=1 Tax=Lophium mytilinum TaxID=390894 RepID=A0A6A6QD10_9PEZI|nr:hypothetical protein BU16DRAFT_596299 [Lophium mytilinum]